MAQQSDWAQLRQKRLMTILDPMVFRTADLYLAGRAAVAGSDNARAEEIWTAIDRNIGALAAFFDALILRTQLPIFSYTATFPNPYLLRLNEEHGFLTPVLVTGQVYKTAKQSALQELRAAKPLPQTLAADILQEMASYGYAWEPGLEDLGPLTDEERRLTAFLLGGLLFGGYAQQLSNKRGSVDERAEHVLQPKRARLHLAAALGDVGRITTDEAVLFQRFKRVAAALPADALHPVQLPEIPSFLPLLLRQDPKTPQDMLRLALHWRRKHSIRAFRQWFAHIEREAHRSFFPPELQRELQHLRRDLARELGSAPEKTLTVSAQIGATLKAASVPEAGIEATLGAERQVNLGRMGWFFQSLLPGKRYRKLFVRMAVAQGRYATLNNHLAEIWHRAA